MLAPQERDEFSLDSFAHLLKISKLQFSKGEEHLSFSHSTCVALSARNHGGCHTMLVLSRREREKVLFPTLGISVEVLRVRGKTTRLGIDAPSDIPVLRHEIAERRFAELTPDASNSGKQERDLAHIVRQRLKNATHVLNQLHQHLDEDDDCKEIAQQVIIDLYNDLQSLERDANRALEGSPMAKSITVLLVEDQVIERKLLGGVLELSGMHVVTACDGQEAMEYLSLHAMPDAVLLDMLMPRCDGPEFVKHVRSDPQLARLKIFAVSSTDPSTLGLSIGEEGLDGWFPKPLEPGELICVLTERLKAGIDKTSELGLAVTAADT